MGLVLKLMIFCAHLHICAYHLIYMNGCLVVWQDSQLIFEHRHALSKSKKTSPRMCECIKGERKRANNPLFGGHLFLGMVVEYPWNLNWKWICHEIAGMHADHVISMLKTVQDVSCSLLIGAHQSRVTVQSAPSSGYPPLFSSRLMGPGEMIAPLNSMWSFGHITLITQSLAEPHELFGYGPTKNDQIRRSPILTSTVPFPVKDTPDDPTWGRVSGGTGKGLLYPFGVWTKMTVPVRSHSGNS